MRCALKLVLIRVILAVMAAALAYDRRPVLASSKQPGHRRWVPGSNSGRTPAMIGIDSVRAYLDRVQSRRAFGEQLARVALYVVTDDAGHPVLSHYPMGGPKDQKQRPAQEVMGTATKKMPVASELVKQLITLFSDSSAHLASSTHDISTMSRQMPKVALYFVEPTACSAQVRHLKEQGNEANMERVTLQDYIYTLLHPRRQWDPILLPSAEALIHATQSGKQVFKGTPVFITDPPIVKSTEQDPKAEFDPKKDKFMVFLSPGEATAFYRKVWWNKGVTSSDEGSPGYCKILGSSRPMSPTVRYTSIEKIARLVNSSEAYWGSLIELVPPKVQLDKDTQQDISNRETSIVRLVAKLGSFWY